MRLCVSNCWLWFGPSILPISRGDASVAFSAPMAPCEERLQTNSFASVNIDCCALSYGGSRLGIFMDIASLSALSPRGRTTAVIWLGLTPCFARGGGAPFSSIRHYSPKPRNVVLTGFIAQTPFTTGVRAFAWFITDKADVEQVVKLPSPNWRVAALLVHAWRDGSSCWPLYLPLPFTVGAQAGQHLDAIDSVFVSRWRCVLPRRAPRLTAAGWRFGMGLNHAGVA